MENCSEKTLLEEHSGPLFDSYRSSGLLPVELELPDSHTDAVLNYVTRSGNLILVHNTCCDLATVRSVNERANSYWCLCPGSNIYIENQLPPVEMLKTEGCKIVIGTDSLASNTSLSVFGEMKLLQANFPWLSLTDLVQWATVNGAWALGSPDRFGTIEPGKNPGLILISDADLPNLKLLPGSIVKRLV
jgi:cytosine/adenosine deaminase-related metal-dependent hydrolase